MSNLKAINTLASALTWFIASATVTPCLAAAETNVAVVVYAQSPEVQPFIRTAQARLEQLLSDNGFVVLDEGKARELRSGHGQMSDPTFLLTAEEFQRIARQYRIDGIFRVYLTGSSTQQFGFYSASAHADFRYVSADANVAATESAPMGIKGFPPSDGLTESAALTNAVQRAIDSAALRRALRVVDEVLPRTFAISLSRVSSESIGEPLPRTTAPTILDALAKLQTEDRKRENITCRALSPDGGLAALAGAEHYTTFNGGMSRQYGSRMHIVDIAEKKEILTLEMHPLANRERGENGTSEVLDCRFIGSWRYLAAVSGNKLAVWDVERGLLVAEEKFTEGLTPARLEVLHDASADYLAIQSPQKKALYAITAKK